MNTITKTTTVKLPGTVIAFAIALVGLIVAYAVPLSVAPYALPLSIVVAVIAWIGIALRNEDGSSLSVAGTCFILFFGTMFAGGFYYMVMAAYPGAAPRAPLMTWQYVEVSKSLEQSPTPAVRARRNQILAEEARDGALDLRGYLIYLDRVSVDTVERQLGNAG
jgi:hypothetical protein